MCGIWGSNRNYDLEIVQKKLDFMKFRGPDHTGIFESRPVQLGSNRLSIVDQSLVSNMPFQKHQHVLVFNGEIYNFRELRKMYLNHVAFITDSDTEVLLELYLKYGPECLNMLNGMFAFVIYDIENQLFFGARDRLGIKPLYYYHANSAFEFSSQPKPIVIGNVPTIDLNAQLQYFIWTHIPDPFCIYKGVSKLSPGCYFQFNNKSGILKIQHYWDVKNIEIIPNRKWKLDEWKEQLEELIEDAIKIRIPESVNFGVALSGGIDSSLITAMAASNIPDLRTYTVSFEDCIYNEGVYAKHISNLLKTNHTDILCTARDSLKVLENLPLHFDEPFSDSSAIPSTLLFETVSKDCPVLLTGDGADESFFGYPRYWKTLNTSNSFLREGFKWSLANLFGLSNISKQKFNNIGQYYLDLMISSNIQSIIEPNVLIAARSCVAENYIVKKESMVSDMMGFDLRYYLNNDINTKMDRSAMFHSVETRSPFMDYRLVNFAKSIPFEFLYDGTSGKKILKDLLYNKLTLDLFDRPKKGFSVPIKNWFRNEMKDYVLDLVTKNNLNRIAIIDTDKMLKLRDRHLDGKIDDSKIIFSIIVYINWLNFNKL